MEANRLPGKLLKNISSLDRAYQLGTRDDVLFPAVYVIEPTNVCNFACVMCPNSQYRKSELGSMDFGTFSNIVDQIEDYAAAVMLYFVGEPLLHKRIVDMVSLLKEKTRAKVILSTNASRLREPISSGLIDAGLDELIVGMDGNSARSFSQIRIGGDFDQVVSNVEQFLTARGRGRKPLCIVQFLEMTANADEVDAFFERWRDHDCVPLVTWVDTWAEQMPELRRVARRLSPYAGLERQACADLWFKMVINWRGQVALCCHDWRSSHGLGDLNRESVEAVWNGPHIAQLRQSHHKRAFAGLPLCDGCTEWATREEEHAFWDSPHIGFTFEPELRSPSTGPESPLADAARPSTQSGAVDLSDDRLA